MVMQYWWGNDYTDDKIFEQVHGRRYELAKDLSEPMGFPNAQKLAQAAQKLVVPGPKAVVLAGNYYPDLTAS